MALIRTCSPFNDPVTKPGAGMRLTFLPGTAINITLLDGSTPVITGDIQLSLNNVAVSPTINKPSNVTTINYQPPGNLALSSVNTVTLVFNDTASTLVTNTWTFTVASQFVIAEHVGLNNPTTEGFFTAYNNGANLAGGNDGVSNFWDISSPSGGSGLLYREPDAIGFR